MRRRAWRRRTADSATASEGRARRALADASIAEKRWTRSRRPIRKTPALLLLVKSRLCPIADKQAPSHFRRGGERDFGQRVGDHAVGSDHGCGRKQTHDPPVASVEVGTDPASSATAPRRDTGARGHRRVANRDSADDADIVRAAQVHDVFNRTGYPQVTAGVHQGAIHTATLQPVDCTINRIALGDAAEIEPERTVQAHMTSVDQLHVAPTGSKIGRKWRAGLGQKTSRNEYARDARIETSAGELGKFERAAQNFNRTRIESHRGAYRRCVQPRQIAVRLVKTHTAMDNLHLGESRLDGTARGSVVPRVRAYLDESAEQRPRTPQFDAHVCAFKA